MILYKYYSYEAGIAALTSRRLGFREPIYFNDPFELSYLSDADCRAEDKNAFSKLIDNIKRSVVILSLTRTPYNPLMWANYGENHTGFVIGYEVDDDFLTNESFNLIPVNTGDVVYTSSKSPFEVNEDTIDLLRQSWLVAKGVELNDSQIVNPEEVEIILRKILLYKHLCWAYEEEVRVVKVLHALFHSAENWQRHPKRGFDTLTKMVKPGYGCIIINGLYIYRYMVSIKEVFIGIRNSLRDNDLKNKTSEIDYSLCNLAQDHGWVISNMIMDNNSWGLDSIETSTDILAIPKKEMGLINSFTFDSQEAEYLQRVLPKITLSPEDRFEVTNWSGEIYLKRNGEFIL